MKRCPECRRDYYDDTLLYCLDDGNALLEGPATRSEPGAVATGFPADEPPTAILSEPGAVATGFRADEAATRAQIQATAAEPQSQDGGLSEKQSFSANRAAKPQSHVGEVSEKQSFSSNRAAKPLMLAAAALAVLVGGFFTYRYFSSTDTAQINSIAVMPFANESGNPEVEYLSDGLTEALIDSLSKFPNLSIKSRTSVFRYKGREVEPRSIGKELNVGAILTGRMVQRGDELALSLELIDSGNENVIWSGRYARNMKDIATLQTDTARDVLSQLKLKLAGGRSDSLKSSSTENPEAYILYLKGRFQVAKFTREGLDLGLKYFNEAIEKDPGYANAYAGIAYYYVVAADWFVPSDESLKKARAAAEKTLSLDPDHADAQGSLAIVKWWHDWNLAEADAAFRRSVELDDGNGNKKAFFGWFLVSTGRVDEGLEYNRQAANLEPLSAEMNMQYGQSLYFARRYDAAEEQLRKTINLDKNYWMSHAMLARTLEQKGQREEALSEAKLALELEKEVVEVKSLLARTQAASGNREAAFRILAELDTLSKNRFVPAYNIAEVYAALGDTDRTLDFLEKSFTEHSFYMTFLRTDPVFDKVRSEPRFKTLLEKTGL